MYLSKAFDMVDHNILSGKMSKVCIRGNDRERAELILKENDSVCGDYSG